MWRNRLRNQPIVVHAIWMLLAVEFIAALVGRQWPLAFVALLTFVLTLGPLLVESRFGIRFPTTFLAGIVLFVFATIFLGEAFDFYNRYWWWDLVMHGGSALGFGILGFLFAFMMFEGDRYAAPAWAVAFFGFCFAVMIGATWEIFEYLMDRGFGLNMQKSGLDDTMGDLMVNAVGAALGAASGFFYLKGRALGGFTGVIHEAVKGNRRFFRKFRRD